MPLQYPPVRIGLKTMVGPARNYAGEYGEPLSFRNKMRGLSKYSRVVRLHWKLQKTRARFKHRGGRRFLGIRTGSGKKRLRRLKRVIAKAEARFIRKARLKFRQGRMPSPKVYRELMATVKLSKSSVRARAAHKLLLKMSGRNK